MLIKPQLIIYHSKRFQERPHLLRLYRPSLAQINTKTKEIAFQKAETMGLVDKGGKKYATKIILPYLLEKSGIFDRVKRILKASCNLRRMNMGWIFLLENQFPQRSQYGDLRLKQLFSYRSRLREVTIDLERQPLTSLSIFRSLSFITKLKLKNINIVNSSVELIENVVVKKKRKYLWPRLRQVLLDVYAPVDYFSVSDFTIIIKNLLKILNITTEEDNLRPGSVIVALELIYDVIDYPVEDLIDVLKKSSVINCLNIKINTSVPDNALITVFETTSNLERLDYVEYHDSDYEALGPPGHLRKSILNMKSLKHLKVGSSMPTDPVQAQEFLTNVTELTCLKSFGMRFDVKSSEDLNICYNSCAEAIVKLKSLEDLELEFYKSDSYNGQACSVDNLFEAIGELAGLQRLSLYLENDWLNNDERDLSSFSSLSKLFNLRYLVLKVGAPKVGKTFLQDFCRVLYKLESLESLVLNVESLCAYDRGGLLKVLSSLSNLKRFSSLDLRCVYVESQEEFFINLYKSVKNLKALQDLRLHVLIDRDDSIGQKLKAFSEKIGRSICNEFVLMGYYKAFH